MSTRTCSKCSNTKPISDYYTITNKKSGKVYTYNYCKFCHYHKATKHTAKVWRENNPKKWIKDVQAAQKAMYARDKKGVYILVTTKGLYVGASSKVKSRVQQHRLKHPGSVGYVGAKILFWWILKEESDKRKRLNFERKYIENLQPHLNTMYTTNGAFIGRKKKSY